MKAMTISGLCVLTFVAGCGSESSSPSTAVDSGGQPESSVIDTGTERTPASGTLTLTIDRLADAQGKIVTAFVYPPGGQPGTAPGGACIPITANPFSGTGPVKARKSGGSPCDLEATPLVLDANTYTVLVQLYVPGSKIPEKCAQTTVKVDGNVDVTLPALGTCG